MTQRSLKGVLSAVGISMIVLLSGCTSSTPATESATSTLMPSPTGAASTPTPTPTPTVIPNPTPSPIPHVKPYKKLKIKIVGITPNSGDYGVAMPITVTFNTDVPKRYREQAEKFLTITSTSPIPEAAWSWTTPRTVTFRGKDFWPANTDIHLDADIPTTRILNVQHKENVIFSGGDTITLHIGRSFITRIDSNTHYAIVYKNGKKTRSMPISLGKPGWETRSGTKVVMERYRIKRMTSQAVGDTTTSYDLQVPYSVRITNSGEFMHGAPWAVGRLGRANGSHGCTNLNMSDAAWFFKNAWMGDPVITKHTGRRMEAWNGLGGPWNVKWNEWLAYSATGPQTISSELTSDISSPETPVVASVG